MKHTFLSILFLFISMTTFGAIRYVTPSGAGSLNGSSWANSYGGNSLQIAINASVAGDEVWVAAGTYYTTSGISRIVSFTMKNGVAIYGSFSGNETTVSQRPVAAGLTSVLSAEIGAVGTADNSYHTISNIGLNNTAVIDGFIIKDANDNRASSLTTGAGGGIYNDGNGTGNFCSPTIRNCVITNNSAVFGGGIFNNGYNGGTSNPVIVNCVIANNIATGDGAGIDNFGLSGNASPIITNCVVYNNKASKRAGGMYCWGGNNGNANPTVTNTVFVSNSAIDGGGVVSDRLNSAGGSSGNSNPVFKNCIFWGNTASAAGPQFFLLGGATFNATYSDTDLTGQSTPHIISGNGTGNINSNPGFLDILSGPGSDAKWMTKDDGLQLASSASPAYNKGDNAGVYSTDILSNNRIANTTVDMGAYEFNSTPTAIGAYKGEANRINVFPNPSNGTIDFSGLNVEEIKSISFVNSIGLLVKKVTLDRAIVDISDLSNGIYSVIIVTADKMVTMKVVKE